MKKIAFILTIIILLSSCQIQPNTIRKRNNSKEYKAIWINYNELSMKDENGGTEDTFRIKMSIMLDQISAYGLNAIIVHLRAFSDSFYKSNIFPFSAYVSGKQGQDIDYDPLQIIIEEAEKRSISVEGWINPYRVSYKKEFSDLAENCPAKQWHTEDPETNDLIQFDGGIFYNPSSIRAQKLIIDGVREIVEKYNISKIYMDDYFYPTTSEEIDVTAYQIYTESGGDLSLSDWRRENVNALVSGMYDAIKSSSKDIELVISPAGDIDKNIDLLYADVKKWCSESGYIDVIMPQLYYGFENQSLPFCETADAWGEIILSPDIRLGFAMGFYKSGKEDKYAGTGKNEWMEHSDICARQVQYMRKKEKYIGFSIYSYSYLFEKNKSNIMEKEYQLLKSML